MGKKLLHNSYIMLMSHEENVTARWISSCDMKIMSNIILLSSILTNEWFLEYFSTATHSASSVLTVCFQALFIALVINN